MTPPTCHRPPPHANSSRVPLKAAHESKCWTLTRQTWVSEWRAVEKKLKSGCWIIVEAKPVGLDVLQTANRRLQGVIITPSYRVYIEYILLYREYSSERYVWRKMSCLIIGVKGQSEKTRIQHFSLACAIEGARAAVRLQQIWVLFGLSCAVLVQARCTWLPPKSLAMVSNNTTVFL